MTLTSDSPTFCALSAEFRDTIPATAFSTVQKLNLHTDTLLPIAAGQEAMRRLISLHEPQQPVLQQAADMGGRITPDLRNDFHLEHLVPWKPVSSILNEVSAWQNNAYRALNAEALMVSYGDIRRAVSHHAANFSGLPQSHQSVILDVANVGAMADNLARLTQEGYTNSPYFREIMDALPVPSALPAWASFRANSLS